MQEHEGSTLVGHEPCPACGSSDNLARYDDGHGYCFGQGCGHYEPGEGQAAAPAKTAKAKGLLPVGTYEAIRARRLTEETCRKYGYFVTTMSDGRGVQVEQWRNAEGTIVAQKARDKDKNFTWIGNPKDAVPLGGMWMQGSGRMVVIAEGAISAMSAAQALGLKWPVVWLKDGAASAKKCVTAALSWLNGFDKVVFLLDNDEPGRAATKEAAAILPPGKAFLGVLPDGMDPNDLLKANRVEELVNGIWRAQEFRPDGVVGIEDVLDEALRPTQRGLSWVFPTLDAATFGRRPGEVIGFGGGTGIGKTDVLTEQIAHDVYALGEKVGVVFLEERPAETAKKIAGKHASKRFHIPGDGWSTSELREEIEKLRGKVYFYDSWGETDWEPIATHIRYLAKAHGVRLFYIDHLTAMADTANERESLEQIMKEMAGLANELQVIVHFVSHLATPDGKPHEEGGRVTIRHFKGSRAIGFWSYFLFGLERDQQHPDEEWRNITTFRVLKDRYTGRSTGLIFGLAYDTETGRLSETPFPDEDRDAGLRDAFDDEPSGSFRPQPEPVDDIPF